MSNKKMQFISVPSKKIKEGVIYIPRKRMISPEFWDDEEIAEWSSDAKLFYIGLWNFADDDGRFRAVPKFLKARIFPYTNIDVEILMEEIKDKIQYYESGGQKYGWIKNFKKHQYINHAIPSKLPAPPAIPPFPLEESPATIPNTGMGKDDDPSIPKTKNPTKKRYDNFFETITPEEKTKGNLVWLAINKCIKMKIERNDQSRMVVIVWVRTYPTLNVPLEINKADAWLLSNGKVNKNGIQYFNNWLSNASNYQARDAAVKGRSENSAVNIPGNPREFDNIER